MLKIQIEVYRFVLLDLKQNNCLKKFSNICHIVKRCTMQTLGKSFIVIILLETHVLHDNTHFLIQIIIVRICRTSASHIVMLGDLNFETQNRQDKNVG